MGIPTGGGARSRQSGRTAGILGCAAARGERAFPCPTAVLVSKPMPQFDLRWHPVLPYELLGVTSRRALEGGMVARLGRVGAACCPSPTHLIGVKIYEF